MIEEKKSIDYMGILRKSWEIAWKNKILWWFGFFVSLGGGGQISMNNFNFSGGDKEGEDVPPEVVDNIRYYWSLYYEWIILGVIIFVLVLVIIYLLGILARGALIKSIMLVEKGEKVGFISGLKEGGKVFWRILGLNVLLSVIVISISLILFFPILRLYFLEENGSALALSILAIPIIISVVILAAFLRTYSQIYLTAEEIGVVSSIKLAYSLLKNNLKESLIMGIVMIVVNVMVGIFFIAGLLIAGVPIAGLIAGAFFLLKISETAVVVLSVVALIILIIAMVIFSSGYISFVYAAWIEFFNLIARKEMPEIKKEILQEESENEDIPEPEGIYLEK